MHEIDKIKLLDQTKFRLNETKKIEIILLIILTKQNKTLKNWVNMLLLFIRGLGLK